MITRGHYIGEIIDELAAIGAQVQLRNRLGLTDLSVLVENFFRDLLNAMTDGSLTNLNAERANEPGLDLGDAGAEFAIQVTATATSQKVNLTLGKITAAHRKKYKRFVVLIVGSKQSSYTLDADLAKRLKFSEDRDIWDLDSIARQVVGLSIVRLEAAHRVVQAEVARLKIELELPDSEGRYPTSGYKLWEARAKPSVGDGQAFSAFAAASAGEPLSSIDADLPQALERLAKQLSQLPRVTREFLVMLLERREKKQSKRFHVPWMTLLYDKVLREYRGKDLKGELAILEHAGFVDVRGDDPHDYGPAEIGVWIPSNCEELAHEFVAFVEDKQLDLRKVVGDVDLSAF